MLKDAGLFGRRSRRCRAAIVMTTAGFAPGFKGGGPIRSLSNLAQALKGDFTVRIVTRDRDIGDSAPYPGIRVDAWLRWNSAAIAYCSGAISLCRVLRSAIKRNHSTILYLNSYFHWLFSMLPLALDLIGVIRPTCIVVAPRGEFSPGALAIRSRRKRVFMRLAEMTGFHQRVVWHATTPEEVKDIRRALGDRHDPEIVVARNLTIVSPWTGETSSAGDCRERLKILFLSRIAEKKNLLFVIKSLQIVKAAVELRIAGLLRTMLTGAFVSASWRPCQECEGHGCGAGTVRRRATGTVEGAHLLLAYSRRELWTRDCGGVARGSASPN